MKTRVLATLRQLAALLILTAAGVPAVLELLSHPAGMDRAEVHLESASQQHHADHCLSSMAPSERSTPTAAVPCLIVNYLASAEEQVPFVPFLGQEPRHSVRSRAPPRLIA